MVPNPNAIVPARVPGAEGANVTTSVNDEAGAAVPTVPLADPREKSAGFTLMFAVKLTGRLPEFVRLSAAIPDCPSARELAKVSGLGEMFNTAPCGFSAIVI